MKLQTNLKNGEVVSVVNAIFSVEPKKSVEQDLMAATLDHTMQKSNSTISYQGAILMQQL